MTPTKALPSKALPWRRIVMSAAALVFVSVICLVSPIRSPVANWSYDLLYLLRPKAPPAKTSPVVIVYMDDESHLKLNQEFFKGWDRRIHASLIRRLEKSGAKAIVFDILFESPTVPEEDEALITAARNYGKVFVAAKNVPEIVNNEIQFWRLAPPFDLLQEVTEWGLVESSDDTRIMRKHVYDADVAKTAQSLSFKVAQATLTTPPPQDSTRWINFYGPPGTIQSFSYHEVLNGLIPSFEISNKVVFVGVRLSTGYSGGKGSDDFRTPYTLTTGRKAPGVEVNAVSYLNFLNNDWLRAPTYVSQVFVSLFFSFLVAVCVTVLRPLYAIFSLIGLGILVYLAAGFAAWKFQVCWPWLLVSGFYVPIGCAGAILFALAGSEGAIETKAVVTSDGPQIPDHNLLHVVGRGAYGEVWIAASTFAGSFRAIKIVRRKSFRQARPYERELDGIRRFEPVSRAHPGLVPILHVGTNDEEQFFYYIMEAANDLHTGTRITPEKYVPHTLSNDLAERRAFTPYNTLHLSLQLAAALRFLHSKGLIHRDIKPSNVIFLDGQWKFADAGLVTDIDENRSFVGTEGYIPKEGQGTQAGDIYALGMLIYEALTGLPPDRFPELPTVTGVQSQDLVFLKLNHIMIKACEPELYLRYSSAAELEEDLLRVEVECSLRAVKGIF